MSRATGNKPVTMGGQELQLRFSIMAMAELEDRWNCADINGVLLRLQSPSIRDFIDLLFALTRSNHEEMTREECARLLDDEGIGGTTRALLEAVEISTDKSDEGDGEANPKGASGKRR